MTGPGEVRFSPEATLEQVRALYPNADCAPLHDPDGTRRATATEAAELRQLVGSVLADATDRAEALAVALADPHAALISFRVLVDELRPRRREPHAIYDARLAPTT